MKKKYDNYRNNNNSVQFPPATLIESYDEISPGFAKKFGDILQKEQAHRHSVENAHLRKTARSVYLGQFFGFILLIQLVYIAFFLVKAGDLHGAMFISGGGFLFLTINAYLSFRTTRSFIKKPYHRNNGRK